MRLASQFLELLLKPNQLDKASKCLFQQLREKHGTSKKLEPKTECLEPCKVPRKSFWNIFGRKKERKCIEKTEKPVRECETVEFVTEEQAEYDMKKIAEMGGTVYRTCGTAYVVQKDQLELPETPTTSNEKQILDDMLKDPSLKGQCDPMPPFQSVELRLIQLNERKLHPLYKKLMSVPKRPKAQTPLKSTAPKSPAAPAYKTRSGPVLPDEFPAHLKIKKEIFEKKNIMYEFKRADPPQQMLARMVEMKNNEKPPLIPSTHKRDSKQ